MWLKLIWAVDIDLARYSSQRSSKYNEDDFVRYFNDNKKGGINKATFYYYAKKGNEKKLLISGSIDKPKAELKFRILKDSLLNGRPVISPSGDFVKIKSEKTVKVNFSLFHLGNPGKYTPGEKSRRASRAVKILDPLAKCLCPSLL